MVKAGLSVDHMTIYRWAIIYGAKIEKRSRKYLKSTKNSWGVCELRQKKYLSNLIERP